jgi:hypothetical protein
LPYTTKLPTMMLKIQRYASDMNGTKGRRAGFSHSRNIDDRVALVSFLILCIGIVNISYGIKGDIFSTIGGIAIGLSSGILLGYAMRVKFEASRQPKATAGPGG